MTQWKFTLPRDCRATNHDVIDACVKACIPSGHDVRDYSVYHDMIWSIQDDVVPYVDIGVVIVSLDKTYINIVTIKVEARPERTLGSYCE